MQTKQLTEFHKEKLRNKKQDNNIEPNTFSKQMNIDGLNIKYKNSHQMTYHQINCQNANSNVNIESKLVKSQSNVIILMTNIKVGNRKITIKDIFQAQQEQIKNDGVQNEDGKIQVKKQKRKKNFYLVRRKPYNPIDKKKQKRKLKNSVRNIRRLFQVWIKQNNGLIGSQIKQIIQQQFKKWPNSNNLIKFLIKSLKTRQIFKDFLKNEAKILIINSKIKDKQAQLDAVKSYLRLYQIDYVQIQKQEQQ